MVEAPTMPTPDTVVQRFNAKYTVDPETGCWLWTDSLNRGYGYIRNGHQKVAAHRLSYEHFIGLIPDGLEIDHVKARGCRHKHCVNPAHLEAVTHVENVARGVAGCNMRAKTHCPSGHEYSGVNVLGSRVCRVCDRAAGRAWDQRNREKRRAYYRKKLTSAV